MFSPHRFSNATLALVSILVGVAGFLGLPAAGNGYVTGQCVQDRGGNSCTANDVTFVLVGLGTQRDGCTNVNDTLDIFLGARLQNTTATTRYDIGMYINTDGAGSAYTSGNTCIREGLFPIATNGDNRCVFDTPAGSIQLTDTFVSPNGGAGAGAFYSDDASGDLCGDLKKDGNSTTCNLDGINGWDDTFVVFDNSVSIPCKDADSNGFADLATCATWGNSKNEVDQTGDNLCTSASELYPGTSSKCNCSATQSSVPIARMALSCSCARVNSSTYSCSATYTNPVTCTNPSPTPALANRCGTTAYMRFKNTLDDADHATFSSVVVGANSNNGAVTGSSSLSSPTGTLTWNPRSSVATVPATDGDYIISPGDSATISYTVNISGAGEGELIDNLWSAYFANNTAFTGEILQDDLSSQTIDCSIKFSATWAAITDVRAFADGAGTVVEWKTAAEAASLGFDVYRVDPLSGNETKVSRRMVPAVRRGPGGIYSLLDAGAEGSALRYRIVEREMGGASNVYGPFDVRVTPRPATASPARRSIATSQAKVARKPAPRLRAEAPITSASTLSGAAKLLVSAPGVYRVTATELAGAMGRTPAQVSTAISSKKLAVIQRGLHVAWQAEGNSAIRFVGSAPEGYEAAANVYWVKLLPGFVMASTNASVKGSTSASSFAESRHFEEDLEPRQEGTQDPDSDWWFWAVMAPGVPGYESAEIPVETIGRVAGASTLDVELFGFPGTAPVGGYRAAISLAGTSLGEMNWTAAGGFRKRFNLPSSLLVDGTQTVHIDALAGTLLVDSADLGYRRSFAAAGDRLEFKAESATAVQLRDFASGPIQVLDVSDRLRPVVLSGLVTKSDGQGGLGTYFKPTAGHRYFAFGPGAIAAPVVQSDARSDLRNPANGADYVVITSALLHSGAQALADYRSSTGLSTLVVDIEDIWDEFSWGLVDPRATRRFLDHAAHNWQTPPSYVVLAGRGTFDYRDLWAVGDNFVPPMLANSVLGLVATDVALTDFDNDGVPDIPIGRIPATSSAALQAFTNKLSAYERSSGGDWTQRAVALADNAEGGFDFPGDSSEIEQLISDDGRGDILPIHLGVAPYASVSDARTALLSGLGGGAFLFNFVGHGGFDRLTSEGLLLDSDASSLGNGEKLPVLTAQTCYVNYFAFPGYPAIAESLLLANDGGVLASWAPGGLSVNVPAIDLGEDVVDEIAKLAGGRLGERVKAGLATYLGGGGSRLNSTPYNLLGDPATELK